MLCILCLADSDQVIHIFEEQGLSLNVSSIIMKHFWLQPSQDDDNSKWICCSCWNALDSFHEFYQKVEAAHLNLLNAENAIEGELKEEDASDTDNFEACTDFLPTDVKLEAKEDGDVSDPLLDVKIKVDSLEVLDNTKHSVDSDSDSDIPLAKLAQRTKSAAIERLNLKADDSANDNGNVRDLVTNKKESPERSNSQRKPTEPEGEQNREKRKVIDPVTKRERSRRFDNIIHNYMKLSCNICYVQLDNFFLLKKHYHSAHKERGYATCCGKKFLKRGLLVDHISLHLRPEFFKCEKCNRVMADRRGLEVHMSIHDTTKQRIYQCNECSKSFYRKLLLERHMHVHIPDRNIACNFCEKFFSSKYTLRQHENNVHNTSYLKICEQCGKSIRGLEAFRRHQLEHSGVPLPLIQCGKCSVKLTTKYGLKRHMDSMHPETKIIHECKVCGKTAPSAAALQRHTSYMHKCERNQKCPMCDKAFKKPAILREHMTTHTGEVLYTCPHCPKTFNSNANMHSHRKKMHRKEWEENRRHPHMGSSSNAE